MLKFRIINNFPLYLIILLYLFLLLVCINNFYFWDNIQQTSKEAIWFFEHNFSSILLPGFSIDEPITGTGYHPPLTGLITAFLWKIFGMKLWVSHVFIFFVSLLLIFNTYKLAQALFDIKLAPWFTFFILIDSTILSQFSISSPDIILLTAFITALRAILSNKKWLLTFSLIFLGLVNGRGMLAVVIVFIFYLYYSTDRFKHIFSFKYIADRLLPFIPVLIFITSYYAYYFSIRPWFSINDERFPWSGGWQHPETLFLALKNVISYGLRIVENGRIFIYLTLFAVLISYIIKKKNLNFTKIEKGILIAFFSFFILYLYFAITTKNVISSRYYMPMNFLASMFMFLLIKKKFVLKRIKQIMITIATMLLFGNFWIYPEKRTNFWDGTLAHMSFYSTRNKCMNYLDLNSIKLENVAAGFCLYDNQRYIDLQPSDRIILKSIQPQTEYFLYSNISNLSDEFIDELNNKKKWTSQKEFHEGFVFIKVLKKVN